MTGTSGIFDLGLLRDPVQAPGRPLVRVLLVAPYTARGGGMGQIMAYLAACGADAGVEFEMVESRGNGSAPASAFHMLRAAVRIVHVFASGNRAIVHLNFGEGGSLARKGILLLVADALGLPTVLHLHASDMSGSYAGLGRVPRALVRLVFRRAGICVVLGPMWREWLVKVLGVTPSRIAILRNGVPQPRVVSARERSGNFTFVFLGNLLPRKGLPDLLHALSMIRDDGRPSVPPWRLLIAGSGASASLHSLARELGLADTVRFLGWCDRAAATELLRQADALVLPSYHEALPLVLLEAASLGVPVVATYVGAVPEIFTNGHDALLVSPGDRPALAGALGVLMRDAGFKRRIGENARQLYEKNFTLDAFVGGMAEIYAGLAGDVG